MAGEHSCIGQVTYVRWHFNIRALAKTHTCVGDCTYVKLMYPAALRFSRCRVEESMRYQSSITKMPFARMGSSLPKEIVVPVRISRPEVFP